MNQFFSNKKLIILLVSMIVSLGLIAFSITGSGNIPIIQQLTNDITAVVSRLVAKPTNAVVDFLESVDGLKNTYEENQLLKSKIDKLYETEVEIADLKQNNQKLKEQLNLSDTLSDYEAINGAVLSRNPDSWVDKIVVDKGSQNGIELDMSVMSGNGLIGRVVEVNPTSSKVQLITTLDQNNNRVAASVDTDGGVIHGIVNGYDSETDRLVMKQITNEAELKEGDQVMTSGLGGISPSALLIGTIDEVKLDSFGLSQEAYIIPAADTNDIRYVTLIKRTAESGE
ncbi:rod shape-determining protein MreC [Carnobacterium pleistocenium]|uniref:rod shape-determining protein MreC n=1 Tax=Carnobacterium pleistocenium TaxID=181073 RepID=UPI00054E5611|nr:rod shape-determining protein MreC [Carnobacterium pleistocenium]